MKLSIIMPCYNAARMLPVQLQALSEQRWCDTWEIIVADNGCTDHSLTVLKKYESHLPIRLIDASRKRGAYFARNAALQVANGDAFLFCDADDQVGDGWLATAGQALAQHPVIMCRSDFRALNPSWTQFHDNEETRGGMAMLGFPPFCPLGGCSALGIRRSVYEAVGGFDESWRFFGDWEYSVRLFHAGYKIQFVPDAVVRYRYRTTYRSIYRQAKHWGIAYERLYKQYGRTMESDRWRWGAYLRRCKVLLKTCPTDIRHTQGRARLVYHLGWHLGLLQGSLKYAVPPVV